MKDKIDPDAATGRRHRLLVRALYALAVVGGLLATGVVVPGFVLGRWDVVYYDAHPFAVPLAVYLYAYLGVMAYLLVSLVETPRPGRTRLVELAFRVPTALLLVTGVYLLVSLIDLGPVPALTRDVREVALAAYLTGLFVKYALRGLGTVAGRLYPGDPSELLFADDGRGTDPDPE